MKTEFLKRAVCFALVLIFAIPSVALSNENGAYGDGLSLTDPVENTYTGRAQSASLIRQLQFTDMPQNASNQDVIIRGGALGVFNETGRFRPHDAITREEAIVYALRAAGLSERARGLAAAQELPDHISLESAWTVGYLQLASTIGIISTEDFDTALADIITLLDEDIEADTLLPVGFRRAERATREEIASYIVGAMRHENADIFNNAGVGPSLQNFVDRNTIAHERAAAVETLLRQNVLMGQTPTVFGPKGGVTRQQFAQIIRNLDNLHYGIHGLERRIGTVADITNELRAETGEMTRWRHIHVRRADGSVNILRFTNTEGPSPQDGRLDAVVLRHGRVVGLAALEPNDEIEYIVHRETGTVWYVNVRNESLPRTFRQRLEIIDMENGTMTFRDAEYTVITLPMSRGLYGTRPDGVPYIRRSNRLHPAADFPRGSLYDVTVVGNVITAIEFVGDDVLFSEHRGLVIENNPDFGYISILDANRKEQSFTFNLGQLLVHRRQFFDMRDTIGGMHEMFPSVNPHPRTASMSDIIPGDIVVFRVADDDPFRITEIHAAENTISRYGRFMEIRDQGGYFDALMQFENGRTAWYTFAGGVIVLENGRPVSANRIQPGDWARIIINQAILAPGIVMESIREIALDGGGHHINSIITGRLSGFNAAQNQLQLQHARELTPAGWSNHRPLASYNIGGANVRYFHDGRPVTLAHINRYLQRSDATVYMALENHHAGERAAVVSVRSGRDELIRSGTVLSSANNAFNLLEIAGDIQADAGTIVVRNGRLVEPNHINASDWARVALNGHATAAVVDIGQPPATSGVQIVRGRVNRVLPFESFRVESMSLFDGFRWNFTPIAREFTIDHDTIFINSGGAVTNIDSFLGYTDNSVVGDVFNVIVDGGRAVRVIDAPFTEPIPQLENAPGHLTIRGVITSVSGTSVSLRDVTVYNGRTGEWNRISNVNPTGSVTVPGNAIVIDRNQVIPASGLRVGQQIMALSDARRDTVTLAPGLTANAYIVLVEN